MNQYFDFWLTGSRQLTNKLQSLKSNFRKINGMNCIRYSENSFTDKVTQIYMRNSLSIFGRQIADS